MQEVKPMSQTVSTAMNINKFAGKLKGFGSKELKAKPGAKQPLTNLMSNLNKASVVPDSTGSEAKTEAPESNIPNSQSEEPAPSPKSQMEEILRLTQTLEQRLADVERREAKLNSKSSTCTIS